MTEDNSNSFKEQNDILKKYGQIPFDDVDGLLKSIEHSIPYYDMEQFYLYEIHRQIKIYSGMIFLASLMMVFSILL